MFGMNRAEPDEDTRIVVMEVDMDGEPAIVGILADKVHDVTDIEAASIEEAPKVGMRWHPEFIKGIGKRNGGFIIIPNMERIFEISGARTAPVAASEERSAS